MRRPVLPALMAVPMLGVPGALAAGAVAPGPHAVAAAWAWPSRYGPGATGAQSGAISCASAGNRSAGGEHCPTSGIQPQVMTETDGTRACPGGAVTAKPDTGGPIAEPGQGATMDDTPPAGPPLSWLARPRARSWACGTPAQVRSGAVRSFHASLPGYAPTPLTEVPALARELGAGRVFVKDESSRLGLPAFKVLGASWAIHQLLTGSPPRDPVGLAGLRDLAARRPGLVFVTATDGNHGRAVARMARLTATPARVFVRAMTRPATRSAIASEGAEVIEVPGSYDDTVALARQWALDHPGAALVQDTAWPGYEQMPAWIVEGYSTLFAELDTQLATAGAAPPGLVTVPVGVGSLAQAAIAHFRARRGQGDATAGGCLGRGQNSAPKEPPSATAVLAVEPDTAACLLASLRAGRPVSIPTANTIMAGLNCGTVSTAAWPYLSAGLDAAVAVPDNDARNAAADLVAVGISSGPSGAASLAGARAALSGPRSADRRAALGVHPGSVIVLLNTEATHAT